MVNQQYMYSIWKFNTLDCCHQLDARHEEQLAKALAQSNAKHQEQMTKMMLHKKEMFAQFHPLMHFS